jgi:hypothetical protein
MSGSADAEAVVTEVCGVQEYLGDANVLPTRIGAFDVTACMTRPGPYSAGEQRRHVLIRRLEEWPTECDLVCMPVYDFSRASTSVERVRIRRSSDP